MTGHIRQGETPAVAHDCSRIFMISFFVHNGLRVYIMFTLREE